MSLFCALFFGGLGLVIGWNVFPQPKLVKYYFDKIVNRFKDRG